MASLHTLAFEIGTEEIPAFDLHKATAQLEKLVPEALDVVRIPHGAVSVHTTPRRLIVLAEDVADETEALQEVFRGPSAKIAFDAEGKPTKAAIGFARGKGLDVDALERREENGVEYVFAERSVPARDVAELLPGVLEGVITGISWPKSCRWGTRGEYFSRPVRWLVALLDERVVPVEFAGLTAGRLTRGHRFLAPGPHEVAAAADLLPVVEGAFVVTSEQAREQRIRAGVAEAEARTGYRAELPEKTLLEVVNLSEYPTVLVGTFDEEILRVPEEIIVDAMLMHQRYFPLYDGEGRLTNKFIVVTNGVVEFTSVQGVMGSYYAEASGENEQVARAIADHYRPRFSGDEPPASDVGRVVAMADKLDTVCGLFAVGQGPTGSSDPFALRRSAIGITAMLEAGLPVSLMGAVDASLATYADAGIDFDRDDVRAQVADFFVTRTKVMLRDSGASPDAIDAVLAAGVEEPAQVIARVRALEAARTGEREAFDDLATAYARANNLRDAELGEEVDEKLMGDAERVLASAARDVESQVSAALAADDYAAALAALADLRAPIDAFFADVLVMDEDEAVRANRLRLLNRFVGVFTDVADFGKMAKGGK